MSIQGHGIGVRVSYTHKGWRAAKRRADHRIQLHRHRRAECDRLKITMPEYMRRLSDWLYLRKTMEQMRDAELRKGREDAFGELWWEHHEMKSERKAAAASRSVLDEYSPPAPSKDRQDPLRANFGRILPPIS